MEHSLHNLFAFDAYEALKKSSRQDDKGIGACPEIADLT
jgi:hypothetical protein